MRWVRENHFWTGRVAGPGATVGNIMQWDMDFAVAVALTSTTMGTDGTLPENQETYYQDGLWKVGHDCVRRPVLETVQAVRYNTTAVTKSAFMFTADQQSCGGFGMAAERGDQMRFNHELPLDWSGKLTGYMTTWTAQSGGASNAVSVCVSWERLIINPKPQVDDGNA